MAARRSRGDGGLHFDTVRQRWIATASLGYDPAGKLPSLPARSCARRMSSQR
jgi:hypothetical protein